jgi:hypothetical protein
MMRTGILTILACLGVVVVQPALAQSAALTGQVSSAAEPIMEGVLVSAKKSGSTVTVTVVSDDKGRYAFPADRLEPGTYAISTRAIGYKLDAQRGRIRASVPAHGALFARLDADPSATVAAGAARRARCRDR